MVELKQASQYETVEMAQGNMLKRQGGLGQHNCRVTLHSFLHAKLTEQTVHSSGKNSFIRTVVYSKGLVFRPLPSV